MNIKSFINLSVATIAIFVFTSCNTKNDSVKVGMLLPMTGNSANYGDIMKKGSDLALKQAEKKYGKAPFSLVYEDSKGNAKDGVLGMRKLLAADKAPVVVTAFTGVILAVTPIAEEAKSVVINGPANSVKLRNSSPYLFNMCTLADQEGSFLAEVVGKKLNKNEVIFFYQNSEFGVGYRNVFEKEFSKYGGKVVLSEPHDQNASQFKESILKAKNTGCQTAIVISYYKESALLIKQSAELGWHPQWISYSGIEAPEFLQLSNGTANGLLYSQPGFVADMNNPVVVDFINAFKEKYGSEPDIWAAQFFDIVSILTEAFRSGAKTGDEMRRFLQSYETKYSVTGFNKFGSDQCVDRRIFLKEVVNNTFQLYNQ
jgi:branched-chain amino acid transport system substrate-binding protein